jgi:hypothetical protein
MGKTKIKKEIEKIRTKRRLKERINYLAELVGRSNLDKSEIKQVEDKVVEITTICVEANNRL